jgi:hypothetical protein
LNVLFATVSLSHDDFTWDGKTKYGPIYMSIDNAANCLDKNGRLSLCCLPGNLEHIEDAIEPVVESLKKMEYGFQCYVKALNKVLQRIITFANDIVRHGIRAGVEVSG